MTTKAVFKCGKCGYEEEYSICVICHGAIDFPHKNPTCKKCGTVMCIKPETIRTLKR